MRADSRQPSDMTMPTSGCSTIWRGKEVTVFIAASDYAPRDVASPDCDMAGQSAMIPILVET
jgi:hypothetical protein